MAGSTILILIGMLVLSAYCQECPPEFEGLCKTGKFRSEISICGSGYWQTKIYREYECIDGTIVPLAVSPTNLSNERYRESSTDCRFLVTLSSAMPASSAQVDELPLSPASPSLVGSRVSDGAQPSSATPSIIAGANPLTGILTFFGTGAGACGTTNVDGDNIVAVSRLLFAPHDVDSNPNNNLLCGRKIKAWRKYCERLDYLNDKVVIPQCDGIESDGGSSEMQTIVLEVVDRCEACELNDLDVTEATFSGLAPRVLGRVPITWEWVP